MSRLFPGRIVTDRLVLEALTTDAVDVLEYYRICSGATGEPMDQVTEYVPWDPHEHPGETVEFLESLDERRRTDQQAEYLLRPRPGEDGAGEIAGASGIGVDWDRRMATFGAWLRKPYWGRGYSGERAAAFIELAFEHLDLEVAMVEHESGNDNSRRAITKYVEAHGGGHDAALRNRMPDPDGPTDLHRYSVHRSEYRDSPGGERSAIRTLDWTTE